MPDRYSYVKMGERDIDNAMPWDKIEPANYKTWNKQNNFDQAIANSKRRMSENYQFQLIDENAKWINDRSEEHVYSLKLDKFRTAQEALETTAKKYKSIAKYQNNLEFVSLPNEEAAVAKDATLKEKRERWHKSLAKDIYIEEAINVLDDLSSKAVNSSVTLKKKEKLVKS